MHKNNLLEYKLPAFLLFGFLAGIRFINLDKLPVFTDETNYLFFSDNFSQNPESFLDSTKIAVMPVAIWIQGILFKINNHFLNLLILGRSLSVIYEFISAFLLFLIGKNLVGVRVGILTSFIYLIIPLNFFHGRVVVLEPLTNLLTILAVYLISDGLKKQSMIGKINIARILFISITIILAFFTKPLVVVATFGIIGLPLFYIFSSKKITKMFILNFSLLGFITLLIIYLLYSPLAHIFSQAYVSEQTSFSFVLTSFKSNLWKVYWWTRTYIPSTVLLITFAAIFYGIIKKSWQLLWLTTWLGGTIILSCLFSESFFPRHLFMIVAPISLLCGYALNNLITVNKIIGFLMIIPISFSSLLLNAKFIIDPSTAPMAFEDKQAFYEDWSSGIGMDKVALQLKVLSQDQKINVFVENRPDQVWVLNNLYDIGNATIYASDNLTKGLFIEDFLLKKAAPYSSYLILNRNPDAPLLWPVSLVFSSPKGNNRHVNFYKINNYLSTGN